MAPLPRPGRKAPFAARAGKAPGAYCAAFSKGGELHGDGRARTHLAFQRKLRANARSDVFDNGKAQARAPRLFRAAFIHAVKALEHALAVLLGNADAGVAHGDGGHDVALLRRRACPAP